MIINISGYEYEIDDEDYGIEKEKWMTPMELQRVFNDPERFEILSMRFDEQKYHEELAVLDKSKVQDL